MYFMPARATWFRRAGDRTDALVEPGARSGYGLALGRGRGASCRQKLRKLRAVARGQVNFVAIFAAKAVADETHGRGRRGDGICGESRGHDVGSRCAGRDRAARHKRNTTGNDKALLSRRIRNPLPPLRLARHEPMHHRMTTAPNKCRSRYRRRPRRLGGRLAACAGRRAGRAA